MQLQILKKQHMAISNTVQTLNVNFCLPVLTTIVKTFTQITLILYYYASQVQKHDVSKGNLEKQNYQEHLIIVSVAYYFIKIALIVWACETGKNQAIDIRTTIHDVFNSTSDKEIKYELKTFSLQLMQRDNIFSAKGLIVNAMLLTEVTCFKQINDSLDYLRQYMTNNEPYLLNRTYHKQRNPFVLMQLKALMKQHLAISDAVQMLTMIFSLQFLSTIILAFIEITFNLYYYLVQIQNNVFMSDQIKQTYNEVFIIAVMYDIIKIMLIIWACQTGKNQILEINSTIHDVYNSTSNKDIKYELRLFSLQLMHCKNIFSTKVLIVDATLLTTMMGGITTYLLILIQFFLMSNSCSTKTNFTHVEVY
ncbi:Putative gustatory receptor 28b [Trachymyrmex zeteki]|uniref:Gustatory receptor n=1 Tax=Mycetomoellerius zeteki TaxID=64791 RepID=A0A151WYT7_9HYME|nr:Putative gustatory receptor 28b [Trachymyrmex zeteki]